MVSAADRRIRDARKTLIPIALRTCIQSARSRQQTACALIREAHHRSTSSNARGLSDYIAVALPLKCQLSRTRFEILGKILEAHDVVDVRERVLVVLI